MVRCAAGLLLVTALWAAARERVVVDTDCGVFGDDGAALVMLLRSPAQVSLAGITITSGNVWSAQSAGYCTTSWTCSKRQVPVYAGAEMPLVHTAAMAKEGERRWGKLEFIGAFAEKQGAPGGSRAQSSPGAAWST